MSVSFRPLRESDIDALGQLALRADPLGWNTQNIRDAFNSKNEILLIELDGKVIGYSVLLPTLDEAELLEIAIDPAFQGKGYGKALLKESLHLCLQRGIHRIYLEVRVSNTRARNLYNSFGFVQIGLRKGYYKTQTAREDALTMAVTL